MLLSLSRLGWIRPLLTASSVAIVVFLLCPLVLLMVLSFGSSQWFEFPPHSFTFRWYQSIISNPEWMQSLATSLEVGCVVALLSVLLGTLSAFGIMRCPARIRGSLETVFLLPMIFPVVVTAVSVYLFFSTTHLNGTFVGFVIGHLVIALPFAVSAVLNGLKELDGAVEDAAVLCGASRLQAAFRVTLPALKSSLTSAAVFSFLASWDDVVVAIFMSSPSLQTIPVKIWGNLQQDLSPDIAAVSTFLIVSSGIVIFCMNRVQGGAEE